MSKTAIYLRVSTKDQSVESQRSEMVPYLRSKGLDPAACQWYVDPGVSGATMERPQLDRLRAAVKAGRIKRVVVYDLDRLSRSLIGGLRLIDEWVNAGIEISIVTFPVDLSGEAGPLIAAAYLWTAEHFLRRLKKGQRAGIAAAKLQCACCYARGEKIALQAGKCPLCGGTERRKLGGGSHRKGKRKVPWPVVRDLLAKGLSQRATARACRVSFSTVKSMVKEDKAGRN